MDSLVRHEMSKARFLAICAAAFMIPWAPARAADLVCGFQATGGLSLSFGILDPSAAVTVSIPVAAVSLNSDKAGDCQPASQTFTISADNGLYFSGGSRRMKSAAGDFIPYTLTAVPFTQARPGNNKYVAFTFNGVVTASAYQDAPAGYYSDTVTISVTP